MNLVRTLITLFMVVVLALCAAGWVSAGGLPAAKMGGARFILAMCGLSSVFCLWILWRVAPARINPE